MKRRLFTLILGVVLLSIQAIAQQRAVSGKVTAAENGSPLPGVSVKIKGTALGTSTDAEGNYSIKANRGETLVFTSVGMESQEHVVGASDKINVTLKSTSKTLNEVIVTGTSEGTTRKQLGTYVSTVSGEELNKGASGNVLAALQGKAAGAQIIQNSGDPAGGVSVRLRGISSISSSSEPLYIIDGIIANNSTTRVTNTSANYDGANFVGTIGQNRLVDINPADIERIEILNGAAAAAIYGSRANAGVVQIFTKRGKTGAPVVSFSTSITMSELRKRLEVNRAPVKFGGSPDTQTQDILTPSLTNTTPVTRYDYQDNIFQSATGTDNTLSISGGREGTRYYTSASYFANEGIIRNTDFKRITFRANLDQQVNKWASLSVGLNYINSAANEKPDGNSFFSPINSITILGNFHDITTRDEQGNLKAPGERGRVNPISVIEDMQQRQENNRILANAKLKLYPVKNLTIDYTIGVDNSTQNGTTYIPPFAYNVSPAFYGGGITLDPTQNGYSGKAVNSALLINSELNANYNWQISDALESTSQLGYSYQYEKGSYSLLQGRGLGPLIQTVESASTALPGTDGRTELSVSGAYLQQNFKYKDHFFVTGAVRMDGSSVFGEDQRNQLYLKASASYVLSSAEYWKKLNVSSWWNLFKLRAAYGQSGNLTGIGPYQRFNSYHTQPFLGRSSLYSSATLANEDVKPERQQELEIGTDLSFLNDRVGLQFNWYNKRVNDLLLSIQIAPTTGFSSLLDNFGSLENKGYEIVLTGAPVRKSDFKWDATFIFNRNRNKALKTGGLRLLSTNAGAPIAIIDGQPVGVFYGTFFASDGSGQLTNAAGIPQQEKGVQEGTLEYTPQRDANGLPTGTSLRKVIGDPNPDYTSSLVNEFSYKKLGLRVQFDAVQGVDVFNADFRTRQGVGNGKVAEKEHLGELPRGYISGVYTTEEWRIDDGSFIKLREISLSYAVGNVNFLKDLTVSLSGRNLISWDDYKGYDPEVNSAGQSTILRGIDFGTVPIPRTFSLGLQAKF